MPLVEFKNICKSFKTGGKETVICDNFDLAVEKGELVAIMGKSGCGKTTILNMIAGIEPIVAIKANIPVVNVDYTLMPESDLSQIVNEIFTAINFVCGRYGFKKIHTVGDSAGGYLAFLVAIATRNRHIRHGLWVFEKPRAIAESAGLICPGIVNNPKEFPGIYFEKKIDSKTEQKRLPDYAYDLRMLAERDPELRVCVIAGEDDFLLAQNLKRCKC